MRTKKRFLRRNTGEYSRLGMGRKKLQKWRRPKGRDNKMRLKEKGRPRTVEIGYKQDSNVRGKIEGKEIIFIQNIEELKKLNKGSAVNLGRFGSKKMIEILKIAEEKDLNIVNFSISKFEKKTKSKIHNKKKKINEKKESKEVKTIKQTKEESK